MVFFRNHPSYIPIPPRPKNLYFRAQGTEDVNTIPSPIPIPSSTPRLNPTTTASGFTFPFPPRRAPFELLDNYIQDPPTHANLHIKALEIHNCLDHWYLRARKLLLRENEIITDLLILTESWEYISRWDRPDSMAESEMRFSRRISSKYHEWLSLGELLMDYLDKSCQLLSVVAHMPPQPAIPHNDPEKDENEQIPQLSPQPITSPLVNNCEYPYYDHVDLDSRLYQAALFWWQYHSFSACTVWDLYNIVFGRLANRYLSPVVSSQFYPPGEDPYPADQNTTLRQKRMALIRRRGWDEAQWYLLMSSKPHYYPVRWDLHTEKNEESETNQRELFNKKKREEIVEANQKVKYYLHILAPWLMGTVLGPEIWNHNLLR